MRATAAIVITTRKITTLYNGRSPFHIDFPHDAQARLRSAVPDCTHSRTSAAYSSFADVLKRCPQNANCSICPTPLLAMTHETVTINTNDKSRSVRAPCGKANAALFRKRRSTDRHSHRLTPATLDGVSTTLMNEQTTETPSTTRRVTDTTLLIVAIVAVATWLWRRLRRPATVDAASETTAEQTLDDKIGGAVGFPPNNAPV
jgi:hypothetical protein